MLLRRLTAAVSSARRQRGRARPLRGQSGNLGFPLRQGQAPALRAVLSIGRPVLAVLPMLGPAALRVGPGDCGLGAAPRHPTDP
jgi:hypothetical protein